MRLSSEEYTCQCRRHSFHPWSRKIPQAKEELSPCAPSAQPLLWSPPAAPAEPPVLQIRGPAHPGARALHRGEPPPWEPVRPSWGAASTCRTQRQPLHSSEATAQPRPPSPLWRAPPWLPPRMWRRLWTLGLHLLLPKSWVHSVNGHGAFFLWIYKDCFSQPLASSSERVSFLLITGKQP